MVLGTELLEQEDPVAALGVFRAVVAERSVDVPGRLGLGRVHLMLGRPHEAIAYAEQVLREDRRHQGAMALHVQALIRARKFHSAVRVADAYVRRIGEPDVGMLAAQASALFRVQRNREAAAIYHRVLARDPLHAEAHLRLGSGLSAPRKVVVSDGLRAGVRQMRGGRLREAIGSFHKVLRQEPGNPIAHRLMGETLFRQRAVTSMANTDTAYSRLADALPSPDLGEAPLAEFLPGFEDLDADRRAVVERGLGLFHKRVRRLVVMGGQHDLLDELERTTDDPSRARLRGEKTFDGRVWDDVRGMGGLQAATGIESLDEAMEFGFDTLTHEVAHQVHFYGLPMIERMRIRELYRKARDEGRFLDYYAASNEAEYFGQGVEAFASFGKRPACEPTHGHTRFELMRKDPALHALIQRLVDFDPLESAPQRELLLREAANVALRSGRPADAAVAAALMKPGEDREEWLRKARRAELLSQSH